MKISVPFPRTGLHLMNPDTTPTLRKYFDLEGNPVSLLKLIKLEPEWAENQIRHRDRLERELAEKTNEVARLRKLMREYIDFIDANMGTTADWPMEAAFDDETTAQRHCDLLNAMKREVKPEDIN